MTTEPVTEYEGREEDTADVLDNMLRMQFTANTVCSAVCTAPCSPIDILAPP